MSRPLYTVVYSPLLYLVRACHGTRLARGARAAVVQDEAQVTDAVGEHKPAAGALGHG